MGQLGLPNTAWSNSGLTLCTESNRPSTPRLGDLIYESDTQETLRWSGTNWKYLPRGEIAKGLRGSSSATTTTTEIGVLRIDDIQLKSGVEYRISTGTLLLDSTVAGDQVVAQIRYTTDGSTPSLTSTVLAVGTAHMGGTNSQGTTVIERVYAPPSDLQLSLLLTLTRGSGTGTVQMLNTTSAPIGIYIDHLGNVVTDVGVAV